MNAITRINRYFSETKSFKMHMLNNYSLGCDYILYYYNKETDNCIAKFRVKLKTT